MGYFKSIMAQEEHQRDVAISIAVKAGVLSACEFHEEVFAPEMFPSVEPAYRLGNTRFSRGEFGEVFKTRTEMTDAIKAAVDEIALDACPLCENLLRD